MGTYALRAARTGTNHTHTLTDMNPRTLLLTTIVAGLGACSQPADKGHREGIDRKALVTRHFVKNTRFDSLCSLTTGNGKFAFTVDATGLQSFPETYLKGVSLGTFSEWGWHSFPDTSGYRYEETLRETDYHGRPVTYAVQWDQPERSRQAANHFRRNPHRVHLGMVGLEILGNEGQPLGKEALADVSQFLDLWEGVVHSRFTVDGEPVEVTTVCHPEQDLIAVKVRSPLFTRGRLQIRLSFPYPSGGHVDDGCDWESPGKHTTVREAGRHRALITRRLDSMVYYTGLEWKGKAALEEVSPHRMVLKPGRRHHTFRFTCSFSPVKESAPSPGYDRTRKAAAVAWNNFWMSGGAIDFSKCTDPRAVELERRVILSQYLTRVQCTGAFPPQETGLTFNSWYGKFHLEMHWWHAVHFALWNRIPLMEASLDWYRTIEPQAAALAARQGFPGVRWPKMVGPDGVDSPSSVGSFLIWQQPHLIYLAELCYRDHPDRKTLEKYSNLVSGTADFMAGYAWRDPDTGTSQLGPWLIPAQERLPASSTLNPPLEVAYWHWGLATAQSWRQRMGLPRNSQWDAILESLPPLAQQDSLYLASATAPDSYTNPRFMGDHPAVTGALGMLPASPLVDEATMRKTFLHILECWDWPSTWGWDYPLMAMTATRLGLPEKAVDALLMPVTKNTYLPNGHNYQDQRLRIYLPGNGGLLAAVALMCAGYDGDEKTNPGFPDDGTWNVQWENLRKMP